MFRIILACFEKFPLIFTNNNVFFCFLLSKGLTAKQQQQYDSPVSQSIKEAQFCYYAVSIKSTHANKHKPTHDKSHSKMAMDVNKTFIQSNF